MKYTTGLGHGLDLLKVFLILQSPISDIYHECEECKVLAAANLGLSRSQTAVRLKVGIKFLSDHCKSMQTLALSDP